MALVKLLAYIIVKQLLFEFFILQYTLMFLLEEQESCCRAYDKSFCFSVAMRLYFLARFFLDLRYKNSDFAVMRPKCEEGCQLLKTDK